MKRYEGYQGYPGPGLQEPGENGCAAREYIPVPTEDPSRASGAELLNGILSSQEVRCHDTKSTEHCEAAVVDLLVSHLLSLGCHSKVSTTTHPAFPRHPPRSSSYCPRPKGSPKLPGSLLGSSVHTANSIAPPGAKERKRMQHRA